MQPAAFSHRASPRLRPCPSPPRRGGLCARVVPPALLLLLVALAGWAGGVRAQGVQRFALPAYPHYGLDVRLDSAAHTLAGRVVVSVPAEDPRAERPVWWFHLPPNRFLAPDPRGPRRQVRSIPFAPDFTTVDLADSMLPEGFSPGRVEILAVEDAEGRRLPFTLADNPQIPQGYSIRDGLLRVERADVARRRLVIRFRTHLPQRYWEGWSEAQILLEHWYPVLANARSESATPTQTAQATPPAAPPAPAAPPSAAGPPAPGPGWEGDPFAPRGGYYDLSVRVDRAWQVMAGRGYTAALAPGERFRMEPDPFPARSLPLLFVQHAASVGTHSYTLSVFSYYGQDNQRVGLLAERVAREFIDFVRRRFRLPAPATRITLIEMDGPPEDMRAVGNMVLIPSVFYRNNPILDRLFLAKLSRALAQIWFGETVWANADTQHWLHLGLSGYLALDFFQSLYGWDAGLHNVVDWLKPRYREHFFEAPVRELIRDGRDAPVMISLRGYPDRRAAMLVGYNKGPLVLRSLAYVMREENFSRLLNRVYNAYGFRTIDLDAFAREAEAIHEAPLDWFFDTWFYGTPRPDFRILGWDYVRVPGGYRVRARLAREPQLPAPVEVVFTAKDGDEVTLRWQTAKAQADVEVFMVDEPDSIALEPREHWLELDRKNNYSDALVRVRPLFDWSKQRELLVTLRGRLGGNAVDGNYVGMGVRASLDEDNELIMIPVYGERTGLVNYELTWRRGHVFSSTYSAHASLIKLGGTRLRAVGMDAHWVRREELVLHSALELRYEEVEAANYYRAGELVYQPFSTAHNVVMEQDAWLEVGRRWTTRIGLTAVNSQESYGSAYDFTTYRTAWANHLLVAADHALELDLVLGTSVGEPPFQKRFFLGGPELLRGYPRTGALSHDEMAAARVGYEWTFSRSVIGGTLQSRRFVGSLFVDEGRGWDRGQEYADATPRRSVGLGLRVDVNLLSVAQFPVRVEVAKPVGDDEYDQPQYILFGVLAF